MEHVKQKLLPILKRKCLKQGQRGEFYMDIGFSTFDSEGLYNASKILLEVIKGDGEINLIGGASPGASPLLGSVLTLCSLLWKPIRGFFVTDETEADKSVVGEIRENDKGAIIDNFATTGDSLIRAIDIVKGKGAVVKKVAVIVDMEKAGREKLLEKGYELISIFTLSDLIG